MPSFSSSVLIPLLGEDAHQVVFQREIEAGFAGVALTAGAAAKLIVDASRLVTLGAEDEQARRLQSHLRVRDPRSPRAL